MPRGPVASAHGSRGKRPRYATGSRGKRPRYATGSNDKRPRDHVASAHGVPWQAPTGPVASAHGMPRGPVASAHGITWQAPTGPVANAHGMPRYFYSPVAYPWAPWACPRILYECHPSFIYSFQSTYATL